MKAIEYVKCNNKQLLQKIANELQDLYPMLAYSIDDFLDGVLKKDWIEELRNDIEAPQAEIHGLTVEYNHSENTFYYKGFGENWREA